MHWPHQFPPFHCLHKELWLVALGHKNSLDITISVTLSRSLFWISVAPLVFSTWPQGVQYSDPLETHFIHWVNSQTCISNHQCPGQLPVVCIFKRQIFVLQGILIEWCSIIYNNCNSISLYVALRSDLMWFGMQFWAKLPGEIRNQ